MARPLRRLLWLTLTSGLVLAFAGPALAQTAEEGKTIFESKCTSCHTIGGGQLVGPDLQGVVDRLGGVDAVIQKILDPASVPPGTMPDLGLSDAEAASIAAYLEAQGGGGGGQTETTPPATETAPPATETAPPATETTAPGAGDAAVGKNLFTGSDHLQNGGPPCMSCHSVAGIGALGGGQLGPDLTNSVAKYNGVAGIQSVLTQVAFPTMIPIFSSQPVTAQEAADLAAFLAEAPQASRPAGSVGKLVLLSFGGIAAFAAFGLVFWRTRPLSVRRRLVPRPNLRRK